MTHLTSAQIHLALNHLPVFGALFATAILAVAAVIRRSTLRNLGFGFLVFAALSAPPVYWTGEGAEEIVEHRPGVSERLIERHEEAAETALVMILAGGVIGAGALLAVRLRRERLLGGLFAAALLSSLVSTGFLVRTAHLGGQIRHDEIRPQRVQGQPQTSSQEAAPRVHAGVGVPPEVRGGGGR